MSEVQPYFLDNAREVLRHAGGDPDKAGPLAEWAQDQRETMPQPDGGGVEQIERSRHHGVIVAEDGQIVAHTWIPTDRLGRATSWHVRKEDLERHGVTADRTAVDLAQGALVQAIGQQVIHVTMSEVCFGAGKPVMAPRMSPLELRARRELTGLSEAAFGAAIGHLGGRSPIRQDTVQRWERGKEPVPAHMPGRLAAIEDATRALVATIQDDFDAWVDVADDDDAQTRTGQPWATTRWVRHAYALARHGVESG